MTKAVFPRVLIAGLAGGTGKRPVSVGVSLALRRKGLRVAPFKKGPDFIDAAWLGEAAGTAGRNLDTFLMPAEAILNSLRRTAPGSPGPSQPWFWAAAPSTRPSGWRVSSSTG